MKVIDNIREKRKPVVVVLTRSYSTGLSVVRGLGIAGYTVDVIASSVKEGKANLVKASKYVRNFTEVISPNKISDNNSELLIEELLKYGELEEKKVVLLPTDDYSASVMDLNRDVLEKIFIMPGIAGGKQGDLKRMMDKSVQSVVAESSGLLVPKEWVISLKEDIVIPEDMIYPCWCKPIESSQGYKTEMKKCESAIELEEHLQKLKERFEDRSFLVQEFLNIDEEVDIEGCCFDQNIIIPGFIKKDYIGEWDKGVPLAGTIVDSHPDIDKYYDKIVAFLRNLHYIGMFDLGVNIINGEIYFNEINLRSGGTNGVYCKNGANISEMFVRGLTGHRIPKKKYSIDESGKTYLYEKVAWEDYLHGIMSKEELDHLVATAELPIMHDDEDPEPEAVFLDDVLNRERYNIKKEENFKTLMDSTGWDRATAEAKVKEARERIGVRLGDYNRKELWRYTEEEQLKIYNDLLERRELIRKKRERCVKATVEMTGWDEEYALNKIKEARKKFGITYDQYRLNKFFLLSEEEQYRKYKEIKEGKEDS